MLFRMLIHHMPQFSCSFQNSRRGEHLSLLERGVVNQKEWLRKTLLMWKPQSSMVHN